MTNSLTGPGQIEIDAVSAQTLQPTNSTVSVGGRVLSANGTGIRSVAVSLTDPTGAVHTALTGSFGYYSFDEIPVGTIVVSLSAKRYTFASPTQVITAMDNVADLDFTALE